MTVAKNRPDPLQLGLWVLAAGVLIYGIYQVILLTWVCDDAFISYRYARNLINGLGLVFNAGERVEGYTNFLWTVIIAGGMWLKLDPLGLSEILGALSFFVTVGLFGWLSYRMFSGGSKLFLPLTALALLLHHECQVFATSGLETSFDTMLISIGFVLLLVAKDIRTYLVAGLVLILAAATRPDSMAFYVMGGLYILLAARVPWRSLLLYLLPLMLLYLPYWVIRYNYYGWPFPNTYYAKSASLPYYSQGLVYLWLYFKSYYVLLLTPCAVVAAVVARRKDLLSFPVADPTGRILLLSILFCCPYLLYVVRSGGDFMFARFFIPITPLLFIALETSIRSLVSQVKIIVPVALVILLMVLLRWDPFTGDRAVAFIANEPAFYPAGYVTEAETTGTLMKRAFAGTTAKIVFRGMYAMYAYYSEAPVAIEGQTGLTDEFIAHQPITERGRPGHEKVAPREYLFKRGVNFMLRGGVAPKTQLDSLTWIRFGSYPCFIVTFDNALMDHLKQFPEIQFMDIRTSLDNAIAHLRTQSDPNILRSYPFLKTYYFDHNQDPEREKWFLQPAAQ